MKMPEHKRMLTTAAASKDQDDLENMARCYLRQEIDPKMATPSETVILRKTGGMRIGFRLTEVHVDGHRVVFVRNVQTGTIAEASGLEEWDVCVGIAGSSSKDLDLKAARDSVRSGVKAEEGCEMSIFRIGPSDRQGAININAPKKPRISQKVTFTLSKHV